ncbi:histone deacetylase family protein [Desulfosudis oleivorans]|uniref:Histone deacetylase superfamily n=1 Tax=Desulfosudis oleivorans (strain DSM 6200 / JCM 39069 / Hxd3) TaxID=96561 RepID=A9A047_DESOH|nr:histone deacetylase [Desulfosudis oleivorans]ABW68966.1 histone deacetylase superfamily [Desulfosudis oleivorans Hxd3]
MLKAKRKTGLVFFPAFDWAIDPTHPEREERLLYTQDQALEEGLFDIDGLVEFKSDVVTEADVSRVHFCVPTVAAVMTESHFISAGSAKRIGVAVMNKEIVNGFALVRPPGHHAKRVVHGARGFCNVNIEAIMIEYLRTFHKVKKVAIVDTDCHHGDGTQDIYWHDPDTLFISIHQDGRTLYPGSGFPEEMGGPNAAGRTLNIPLPPRTSEDGFLHIIENVVLPVLKDFKPDIIVNSAGQDNHYSDPLTDMNFSAQGYARLTELLKPDIAVLEGGYSIEGALPYVNVGIILAMAGVDYSKVKEPGYDPEAIRQSANVTAQIERIGNAVLELWQQRDSLTEQRQAGKEFEERTSRIFYDTDGIYETQHETIRICRECGGALRIDSSSDRGNRILAVHIPLFACDACKATGHQWYDEADVSQYRKVFLQNRPDDAYLEKKA